MTTTPDYLTGITTGRGIARTYADRSLTGKQLEQAKFDLMTTTVAELKAALEIDDDRYTVTVTVYKDPEHPTSVGPTQGLGSGKQMEIR